MPVTICLFVLGSLFAVVGFGLLQTALDAPHGWSAKLPVALAGFVGALASGLMLYVAMTRLLSS